jgi:CDP-diacylglycerol--serine O-phosphatidyltransferase
MISWRYFPPMAFTAAAMFAGLFSLIQAAQGQYLLAAQMIMLALILDGFDGNLARLLRSTSKFGAEFDTFVDILAFGIAPAFLAYQTGLHAYGVWGLILTSAIVFSGMARLSRFRLVDPFRGQQGFLGLPITINASWIALTTYLVESNAWFLAREDYTHGKVAMVLWGCSTALIILQVSTFRYGKPSKSWAMFIPGVVLVLTLLLEPEKLGPVAAAVMCLYALYYAFVSFWLPTPPRRLLVDDEDVLDEDDSFTLKKS